MGAAVYQPRSAEGTVLHRVVRVPDGPITVPAAPAGPLKPRSYDGTVGPVTGPVSEVFSGPNSPIRDIGFVAITPSMPAVVAAARTCTCTPVADCPE